MESGGAKPKNAAFGGAIPKSSSGAVSKKPKDTKWKVETMNKYFQVPEEDGNSRANNNNKASTKRAQVPMARSSSSSRVGFTTSPTPYQRPRRQHSAANLQEHFNPGLSDFAPPTGIPHLQGSFETISHSSVPDRPSFVAGQYDTPGLKPVNAPNPPSRKSSLGFVPPPQPHHQAMFNSYRNNSSPSNLSGSSSVDSAKTGLSFNRKEDATPSPRPSFYQSLSQNDEVELDESRLAPFRRSQTASSSSPETSLSSGSASRADQRAKLKAMLAALAKRNEVADLGTFKENLSCHLRNKAIDGLSQSVASLRELEQNFSQASLTRQRSRQEDPIPEEMAEGAVGGAVGGARPKWPTVGGWADSTEVAHEDMEYDEDPRFYKVYL